MSAARTLKHVFSLAGLGLILAGCGSSLTVHQDQAVASALPYDRVSCQILFMNRNALAAQYGLPLDANPVFVKQPYGIGPLTPDTRTLQRRKAEEARGEIAAMNRSLKRRKCVAPAITDIQ
ncbi:hypothetical protein ACFPLB_16870 [Aquamicrobium segne]|uniref:Lipoprotein n=1 Tax=Aquamicrobium segne TaxID=469547 RepID=A0ABW0H2R5_9HYPH